MKHIIRNQIQQPEVNYSWFVKLYKYSYDDWKKLSLPVSPIWGITWECYLMTQKVLPYLQHMECIKWTVQNSCGIHFFITGPDRIFYFLSCSFFFFYYPYHCTLSVDWSWRALTFTSKLLNTTTFPSSTPINPPKPELYYFVWIYFSHIWSESVFTHLWNMVLLQRTYH